MTAWSYWLTHPPGCMTAWSYFMFDRSYTILNSNISIKRTRRREDFLRPSGVTPAYSVPQPTQWSGFAPALSEVDNWEQVLQYMFINSNLRCLLPVRLRIRSTPYVAGVHDSCSRRYTTWCQRQGSIAVGHARRRRYRRTWIGCLIDPGCVNPFT